MYAILKQSAIKTKNTLRRAGLLLLSRCRCSLSKGTTPLSKYRSNHGEKCLCGGYVNISLSLPLFRKAEDEMIRRREKVSELT